MDSPAQPTVTSDTPSPAVPGVVAQTVVQQAPQVNLPLQPVSLPGGPGDKERAGAVASIPESAPRVEPHEQGEVEPEVEAWVEKLEQAGEVKLPEAIKDEHGAVVLENAPATAVHDQILVPMTQQGVADSKKRPMEDAAKWLAFWIERLTKMFGGRVKFKEN